MRKRVADIVFDTLLENDIDTCFCVVGGGAMHLDNALGTNMQMNKVFNHHEQASAMAAEAYARYSGKMAAVCVTSGPGATNAITGVMGAWVDSLPMIVISGNVRYETSVEYSKLPLRYRGLQEFDIINSVKNMTKYCAVLNDPSLVKSEVQKAITIAMSGRRGPVWIDIPQDIQNSIVETETLIEYSSSNKSNLSDDKLISDIEKIVQTLSSAKKPVILIGSAIQTAHLEDELEEFLKNFKFPVVGGAWLGDIFYNDSPLFYGLSGNVGPRTGNMMIQESDCILVLGNSLSYKQTGYDIKSFAPQAKIIMVDVDQNEINKHNEKIDISLVLDLKEFFKVTSGLKISISAPHQWFETCDALRSKYTAFEGALNAKDTERVNKYYFWKCFFETAPEDIVLALGNSGVDLAANQVGRKFKKQRMIGNYICGSMGYDLPAAIGTAIACKLPVICVTGDGSFMMNLQELQTIKQYELPIKIVVFENEGYGAIKQTCKNFFHGTETGCSPESGVSCPSFEKLAYTFDFKYKCCANNGEIVDSLNFLFNEEGNVFLEVKEILDDPVIPKLMSKLDENGKMTSPKLHEMYPFLDD